MSELINELIGKKVTVYSEQAGNERQDVGVIEAASDHMFKLQKQDGDTLYFTFYLVRMVKPF